MKFTLIVQILFSRMNYKIYELEMYECHFFFLIILCGLLFHNVVDELSLFYLCYHHNDFTRMSNFSFANYLLLLITNFPRDNNIYLTANDHSPKVKDII